MPVRRSLRALNTVACGTLRGSVAGQVVGRPYTSSPVSVCRCLRRRRKPCDFVCCKRPYKNLVWGCSFRGFVKTALCPLFFSTLWQFWQSLFEALQKPGPAPFAQAFLEVWPGALTNWCQRRGALARFSHVFARPHSKDWHTTMGTPTASSHPPRSGLVRLLSSTTISDGRTRLSIA